MGSNFCHYDLNAIHTQLGNSKSLALPVFHAITGCVTTAPFVGKGKKLAWQAWSNYSNITSAFVFLAEHPFHSITVEYNRLKTW